jgi:predicted transcriptional regulator
MDKIFSARVDESIIRQIGHVAQKLHTTKKAVIEAAILAYAEKTEIGEKVDILEETSGAWNRRGSTGETVKKARKIFRDSMKRHQR